MATSAPIRRLVDLNPAITTAEMLAELVPPREFQNATFSSYVPDENFDSQSQAVAELKFRLQQKSKKRGDAVPGFYLDGGFGVGKTHLLVSYFKEFKGKKLFGSFLAYTSFIGAVGFAESLKLLAKFDLIAIDEFELDDPGNTMIMSRLINELGAKGTVFAATSNTPPDALGAGRFAAEDFQREILGIGARFMVIRVDGEDYRHRHTESVGSFDQKDLADWVSASRINSTLDSFPELLKHLASMHPSKYHKLVAGVERVAITGVEKFTDQSDALRFVAFVDRAYEEQIQLRTSGVDPSTAFTPEMIAGAYQKKYRRAISRLAAMAA